MKVLLCLIAASVASDDSRATKKKDESRGKRNLQYNIAHHYTVPFKPPDRRIATGYTLPLYYPPYIPGPRPYTSYHKGRPYSFPMPPYAVQMEPLVHYSQRDPLYDTNSLSLNTDASNHLGKPEDLLTDTNHITENVYGPPIQHTKIIEKPVYIKEPEPIIEIIIKESNVTLPPPPQPIAPPTKKKKEEVQVFYVKYKKNPNGYGKNSIVYDKPVPAISPSVPEEPEEEPPQEYHHHEVVTQPPPPSTTHRTIIKPDSEVYHSPTGVKVTFGKEGFDYSKRSSKPDDYLRDSRPRVHSPFSHGRQLQSFPPNFGRPASSNFETNGEFNFESQRIPQPYRPFNQPPPQPVSQARPNFNSRPPSPVEPSHPRFPSFQAQSPPKVPFSRQPFSSHGPPSPPFHQNIQFPHQTKPVFSPPPRQPVPYKPFENVRNQAPSNVPHPTASTIQFRPEPHFPIRSPAQPFHNVPPPSFGSPNIHNHRFSSPIQTTPPPVQQHFNQGGSLENHQQHNGNNQRQPVFTSSYQTINHQSVNHHHSQVNHQPVLNQQPLNHNHQHLDHQINKQQNSNNQAFNHHQVSSQTNHQAAIQQTVNQQQVNHQPANHRPNYQSITNHQQFNQQPLNQQSHQTLNHQPLNQQPSIHQPVNNQALTQQVFNHEPLRTQNNLQNNFNNANKQQNQLLPSAPLNHQAQQSPSHHSQAFNQQFTQQPQPNHQNSQFQQSRELNHLPEGELIPSLSKFEQHISVNSEEQSAQQYNFQQQNPHDQSQRNQQQNLQQNHDLSNQHQNQHIQNTQPLFQQQPAQSFSVDEYNRKIKEQLESTRFSENNNNNNAQQYQQQELPRFVSPDNARQAHHFNQNLNEQGGSKEEPEINLVYATPKPTAYYQQTTSRPQPQYNVYTSTTARPVTSTTPEPTTAAATPSTTTKDPKILEAELPDEVPEDLRAQLLSSGILNHASISVLDYDKVGDIPLSALPPDQLANFFSAGGGQQIAAGSEQVAQVVKRPDDAEVAEEQDQEMEGSEVEEVTAKQAVQMKVVRYDPRTRHGQRVEQTYLRDDATTLDPVELNGAHYNRYLPLQVNGSTFPIPDVPELRGRRITSVVVLAPVAYDFAPQRRTRQTTTAQAQTVHDLSLIREETLRELVKNPTQENYQRFLERQKETAGEEQSVILLVTGAGDRNEKEIFMYDVVTKGVSKLAGELSTAFVEAAEANAKEATDGDSASNIIETKISYDDGDAKVKKRPAPSYREPDVAASNLDISNAPIAEDLISEDSERSQIFADDSENSAQKNDGTAATQDVNRSEEKTASNDP